MNVIFRPRFRLAWIAMLALLVGCSHDENNLVPPAPRADTIGLTFENPLEIEVNSQRQWALLLHDRTASSGPAIQLVDLQSRTLIGSRILDYYDVYDIEFLPGDDACFAGRPQGNIGYAVQFLHLPDLTLGARVMTADIAGTHGYLAVDTAEGAVYYSHAGGGGRDALYQISLATGTLSDGDRDGQAPYSLDNALVTGLFHHPGRIAYDYAAQKIVVANLEEERITLIDASLWGTLSRDTIPHDPPPGITHLITTWPGLSSVHAEAMAVSYNEAGVGTYVFAGTSGNSPYLSRFGTASNGLDFVEVVSHRSWCYRNGDIRVHPRDDVFSVFVLQEDSTGVGIGQYRLNNLQLVAGSPYHTDAITDSLISAVGIDVLNDRLVIGDARSPRLELVGIRTD